MQHNNIGNDFYETEETIKNSANTQPPSILAQKIILLIGPNQWPENLTWICPVTSEETAFANQNPVAEVVRIGDGKRYLNDEDMSKLLHEVSNSKGRVLLYIDAHGGTDHQNSGGHLLALKLGTYTQSVELLKSISNKLSGKPIDIFMTSCHAGAVPQVNEILPMGSNFVGLSPKDGSTFTEDIYRLVNNLAFSNSIADKITAQNLLLTYLTKALKNDVPPVVSTAKRSNVLSYDSCLNFNRQFTETEKEAIYENLSRYVDKNQLADVIQAFENKNADEINKQFGVSLAVCHAANNEISHPTLADYAKDSDYFNSISKKATSGNFHTQFGHGETYGLSSQLMRKTMPEQNEFNKVIQKKDITKDLIFASDIEEMAKRYHTQLVTDLAKNPEFAASAERLLVLEMQKNNFDHIGHIINIRPDVPLIDGVIQGTIDYFKDYKNHQLDRELESQRNYLSNELKISLESTKPNFENMSAKDALAYEYFLINVSNNFLNQNNAASINQLKERARIIAKSKSDNEINEGIAVIKQLELLTQENLEFVATINQRLMRGQENLQYSLEKITEKVDANKDELSSQTQELTARLEEFGVRVDTKLRNLIEDNAAIRSQLLKTCDYLGKQAAAQKDEKKKKELIANYQGGVDAFGFVKDLGRFLDNKQLCQIGVVGQAGLEIARQIHLLKEMPKLDFASLSNVATIFGAVLSIASLFKKNENPNKQVLAAIRAIANQLFELRTEMHERFDRLETMFGKMYSLMLENFCELRLDNFTIIDMLRNIETELHQEHRDIKDTLNSLTNKLQTVASRQHSTSLYNKITDLYLLVNRITGVHQIDASEFKELFNKIKTEICNLHENNSLLVGEANASPTNIVKSFEEDIANAFSADFNIAALYKQLSDLQIIKPQKFTVINPVVWCWEALAAMTLAQRRYQKSDRPENFISKSELEELKQMFSTGESTKSFLNELQNPYVLLNLQHLYFQAGNNLINQLNEYIRGEEEKVTKELNRNWQQKMESFSEAHIEAFKSQIMPVSTDRNPEWFKAYSMNYHHRCFPGGLGPYWGPSGYQGQQKEIYKNQMQKAYSDFNEKYALELRKPLLKAGQGIEPLNNNHFKLFQNDEVDDHYHQAFLHPIDPTQPILSMPAYYRPNIFFSIRKLMYEAEWLGLGKIEFRYDINQSQFNIYTYFVANGQSHLISTMSTPYNPGMYEGNEAIILYWNGGNFNTDGSITDTVVNTTPTVEENVWVNHVYLPKLTSNQGQREKITFDNQYVLHNATEVHHVNDQSPEIQTIKNLVSNAKQMHSKNVALSLKEKLEHDDVSDLSKALIKFSNLFYLLQSTLMLTFKDHAILNDRKFKFFDNNADEVLIDNQTIKLMRNRIDLLSFLAAYEGNPVSFSKYLQDNIVLTTQLREVFNTLPKSQERLCYNLFTDTLNRFTQLLNYYSKTVVDENMLSHSSSTEEFLSEANEFKDQLLMAIGTAIASVTNPKQQRQMLGIIEQELNRKGITGPSTNMFRAIMAPPKETNASAKEGKQEIQPYGNMRLFVPTAPKQEGKQEGQKVKRSIMEMK